MSENSALESVAEVSLEELPIHELRRRAGEYAHVKTSYKKSDLIKIIEAKGELAKEVKLRSKPVMRVTKPALAMLPDEILPELDSLADKGLKWTIDDETGSITFSGYTNTSCTLDTTPSNILRCARLAVQRGAKPKETSDRAPIEALLREMR